MSKDKFYITKRSNLFDSDGSAFNDSFEILETFDGLDVCKQRFESLVKGLDKKNIINKNSVDLSSESKSQHGTLTTLVSEYRKVEIFKFYENETIALEIIKTDIDPKKFNIEDGVRDFMGCVYLR